MSHDKKHLIIKSALVAATLFSGFAFFAWTVYPNLQISAFHRAFKKSVETGDITHITEKPSLFTPQTYAQPLLRTLFVSLLVKGYGTEDRAISVKLMPIAVNKLEEVIDTMPPYLNAYLNLGKGYEIIGHESKDKKVDETYELKATESYQKALELVPNQQTTLVAYSINLYNRGKIDEAITMLTDAIKVDDRIPDLHYYRGQYLVYQNEKNAPQALAELEAAYNLGSEIDQNLSQKTYQKMLFYFAKTDDKKNIVIVLNRLIKIDARQSSLYSQILDYIITNDAIPELEANK